MSKRSDLLEQVELLKNELNTAVSCKNCLNYEQLIEISQRIDSLVLRLSKKY